jgi:predicted small lipoprotein YifL
MKINSKLSSRSVGALALILGLLAGCGQKGPLSLPKAPAQSASAPAATSP